MISIVYECESVYFNQRNKENNAVFYAGIPNIYMKISKCLAGLEVTNCDY